MDANDLEALQRLLAERPDVDFAYLFGSRARGTAGPRSDYDIAVHLAPAVDAFGYRLHLLEELNRLLHTDAVDLIVLNEAPVLLRHRVVRDGRVLKDALQQRVRFEAQTITEYLDTGHLRSAHYAARRRARAPELTHGR